MLCLLCLRRCFKAMCLGCKCSCCRCRGGFGSCDVDWLGVACSSVVDDLGVVPFVCIVMRVV